ncbi:dicer-like protein [Acrasis kona]|uniref:Dicer-like protein n=1 Tax=Acrasis kona TaxID=1008807 RepID=A0AAW2ZLX1_9EUKA
MTKHNKGTIELECIRMNRKIISIISKQHRQPHKTTFSFVLSSFTMLQQAIEFQKNVDIIKDRQLGRNETNIEKHLNGNLITPIPIRPNAETAEEQINIE